MQDASFFDYRNAAGQEARHRALAAALDDMEAWLGTPSAQVAVFDATNSTTERRSALRARFHGRWQYLFIESICNDTAVLELNYRFKMLYSPDYTATQDTKEALADFRARIKNYEQVYETITDRSLHYIKLIDMVTGRGYMDVNRISGYIPGKIVFFLMQVCKAGVARVRKIWLTRHGESRYNLAGKLGGDSPLSERGEAYARLLPDVIVDRVPLTSSGGTMPVSVWTSTLVRTISTAELLPFPKLRWKVLDEIQVREGVVCFWEGARERERKRVGEKRNTKTKERPPPPPTPTPHQAGAFDGWTYAQIEAAHPDEFAARRRDKLRYRYPAGESYMDVVQRLEPAVIEVERERECVCVVAHQAILRALYGYFTKTPLKVRSGGGGWGRREEDTKNKTHSTPPPPPPTQDIPRLEFPLHTLIELVPKPDGRMAEERIFIDVESETATVLQPPSGVDDPTAWTPWSPAGRVGPFGEAPRDGGGGASMASASAAGGATAATTAAVDSAPPPPPFAPPVVRRSLDAPRAATAPPATDCDSSIGVPSESEAGDGVNACGGDAPAPPPPSSESGGRESRAAALLRRVPSLGRLRALGRRGASGGGAAAPSRSVDGAHPHPAPGSATLARVGSTGHLVQPRPGHTRDGSPSRSPPPPAVPVGSGPVPVPSRGAALATIASGGVSPPPADRPPLYPAERAGIVTSLGSRGGDKEERE